MPVIGDFLLNSKAYVILPEGKDGRKIFRRRTEPPFLEAETRSGQKDQESIRPHDSRVYYSPVLGFGVDRIPSDESKNPDFYRRFYDATCDIWPTGTFLPLLEQSSTKDTSGSNQGPAVIRASTEFKGELVVIAEDVDTICDVHSYVYIGSTTTFDADTVLSNDAVDESIALDTINIGDRLVGLFAFQDNHHVSFQTAIGGTWTAASTDITAALLDASVGRNENRDAGLLAFFDGDVTAVVWDETNSQITFFESTNSAVDFTDKTTNIASGNGPQGIATLIGEDGNEKLILGTKEGLWELDTSFNARHIHPMPSHSDSCRRMAIGPDGALWFSQGVGTDEVFQVFRLFVENSKWRVLPVPNSPHLRDGVPTDMLGTVNYMENSGGYMYVSLGGGASGRKARIIKHNGFGWVPVRKHDTENEKIEWLGVSSHDDDNPRLHYSIRTSSINQDHKFLAKPNAHPLSGASIPRGANGIIDPPTMDGGMPNVDGIMLQAQVSAGSLSADVSGEYINMDYAGDGESRGANDLGDFLSGTKALSWASGAGLSSRTLTPRLNLIRDAGSNTDTPRFLSLEIDYVKDPDVVESWRIIIDLVATATLQGESPETIIAYIQAARDLGTLPTFSYGNSGTKYVKVFIPEWEEEVSEASSEGSVAASNTKAIRKGTVEILLEERI